MDQPNQPAVLPMRRRTRIVCISDTHNCTVSLPKGDVLIHAGDLTNKGSYVELSRAVAWLEKQDFEAKIVIAGNHDVALDEFFYPENSVYFHNNQVPRTHEECLALFKSSPTITYLNHESTTIRLKSPGGPRTQFKVFGSPYSPRYGFWAFYYDAPKSLNNYTDLTTRWDSIPLDSDIVVTHTPPRTHCDETADRRAAGCEALRRALWRVRPLLAVCGHVHDGRGAKRVTWELDSNNVSFEEQSVMQWEDPGHGNKKISLIDLTGRKGPSLVNDGSHPRLSPSHLSASADVVEASSNQPGPNLTTSTASLPNVIDAQAGCSIVGLGGDPDSPRSDQVALLGRLGRRETCIVNAAIMKGGYPHVGGKELSKPIVVDMDLPVWEV